MAWTPAITLSFGKRVQQWWTIDGISETKHIECEFRGPEAILLDLNSLDTGYGDFRRALGKESSSRQIPKFILLYLCMLFLLASTHQISDSENFIDTLPILASSFLSYIIYLPMKHWNIKTLHARSTFVYYSLHYFIRNQYVAQSGVLHSESAPNEIFIRENSSSLEKKRYLGTFALFVWATKDLQRDSPCWIRSGNRGIGESLMKSLSNEEHPMLTRR